MYFQKRIVAELCGALDENGNYSLDTMPLYTEVGDHTIEFKILFFHVFLLY